MTRSLLDQETQLSPTLVGEFNEAWANVHTQAESSAESLRDDMNIVRTLLKDLLGTDHWYTQIDAGDVDTLPDGMPLLDIARKYFIQKWHIAGFENLTVVGHEDATVDTPIKTISDHHDGQGDSAEYGVVVTDTEAYTIAVRDYLTKNPIDDGQNNTVYARLHYSGGSAGEYTLTFHSMQSGVEQDYTFAYPWAIDIGYIWFSRRYKHLGWGGLLDQDFWDLSGPVGTISDSAVTVTGMQWLYNALTTQHDVNLRGDRLGHADTAGDGVNLLKIDNTGTGSNGYFTDGGVDVNLQTVLNELIAQIGGTDSNSYDFTHDYMLADDDSIYPALDKLDTFAWRLAQVTNGDGASLIGSEDAGGYYVGTDVEAILQEIGQKIADVSGWQKEWEEITSLIPANTNHTIPTYLQYTVEYGKNMDVYVDGQLLVEGVGNDYVEVGTVGTFSTTVKFFFPIKPNQNITYMVRK